MNFKKIMKNKWFKWGILPFLLFVLWFLLTCWYIIIFDQSLLVISYNHPTSSFTSITHDKLLKGEKLAGEFTAKDNNLGIVALRFKSFQRVPYKDEDSLRFRIKEKGASTWYYQNTYRSGFTYDMPFLPFGFPVIPDSKGKTYVFELESLKGNWENGVALSTRQPFLVSKYQEDKAVLLSNKLKLVEFGFKKFVNSFRTIDILYSSFIFALPFIFFMLWNSKVRKYLPKYSFAVFLLSVIVVDILFLQILDDLLYIVVPIIWLFLLQASKIDNKYTFVVGLVLLLISPIFLQFNITNVAETAGAWAFIFFVAATFLAILELKKNDKIKRRATISK